MHRWLDRRTPASRLQRSSNSLRSPPLILACTIWLAATTVGATLGLVSRSSTGLCFAAAAIAILLAGAQPLGALAAMLLLGAFTTADLAWNNAPHESTGLPPAMYDALRPDTQQRDRRAASGSASPRSSRTIATASS